EQGTSQATALQSDFAGPTSKASVERDLVASSGNRRRLTQGEALHSELLCVRVQDSPPTLKTHVVQLLAAASAAIASWLPERGTSLATARQSESPSREQARSHKERRLTPGEAHRSETERPRSITILPYRARPV